MVENEDVQEDEHQIAALKELDRLYKDLEKTPPKPLNEAPTQEPEQPSSFFGGFFSKVTKKVSDIQNKTTAVAPKGVYLHGGVGCGKTFCMNLFYDHVNGAWKDTKQHVHFHKFMLGVHQQVRCKESRACFSRRRPLTLSLLDARGENDRRHSRGRFASGNHADTGEGATHLL